LGLAAQRDAIESYARARGWDVVISEEVASGRRGERPVLRQLVASLRRGDALVVAKLDRLTRSLLDFASLVELAKRDGWSLVVVDSGFDLNTPAGRMMASMLATFAQFEAELIGQRTSEALRALPRERRNGRPVYSEDVRARARELREMGHPLHSIGAILAGEGVRPPRGGRTLHGSTVSRLLAE
jgi:DNA invertase Pin-like site-specific DNA recombinase